MITSRVSLFRDPVISALEIKKEERCDMFTVEKPFVTELKVLLALKWSHDPLFLKQDMWLLLSISVENYLIKIQRYQPCRLLFLLWFVSKSWEWEVEIFSKDLRSSFLFIVKNALFFWEGGNLAC